MDFNGLSWRGNKEDVKDVNGYAEEARKSGHDGFIARNVVDVGYTDTDDVPPCTDYVAFASVQIKSATDTIGSFDGGNPNSRYSVTASEAWEGKERHDVAYPPMEAAPWKDFAQRVERFVEAELRNGGLCGVSNPDWEGRAGMPWAELERLRVERKMEFCVREGEKYF